MKLLIIGAVLATVLQSEILSLAVLTVIAVKALIWLLREAAKREV